MKPTSSLFTYIFGDTTSEVIVNSLVIVAGLYLLWRFAFKPIVEIVQNIRMLFQERDLQTLEITPPKQGEIQPAHSNSLIEVLQGRLNKNETLSLEVAGDKKNGIRYCVVAEAHAIPAIQKQLSSYIPELKFKLLKNLQSPKKGAQVYVVKQLRHFAFPLRPHDHHDQTDPMSFIAGSMTKLEDDEEVSMQLVLRQFNSTKPSRIYNKILNKGRTRIDGKFRSFLLQNIGAWLPGLLIGLAFHNWALGLLSTIIIWVAMMFVEKVEKPLTNTEERLFGEIAAKLEQPLLRTDIRFNVYSDEHSNALTNDFIASLQPLNKTGFQMLGLSRYAPRGKWQQYLQKLFNGRSSSVLSRNSSIMSASELASLFHFPYGVIKTEGMVRSHSKTLPAPLSLKGNPDLDILIGINKHHGNETPIGLTTDERERHMYIIGGTGSGKTTMLKYQIHQDMRNDKGVAVVDPHGDLAEELLEHIPPTRRKDLIYLNPDNLDHPIGVNLLEMPEGLSGNDLLREKDRVTESVVSVMRKIFSEDDSGGHRIEYVLRNTIQTALTTDNPTLFTIFRLLNDGKYAKGIINKLKDDDLKAFWKNELGKAGSMQKVKMAAGITAKIGRFLFSASARAMLEQEKSDIDFGDVLDGKILICNFSKGRLGEDTSTLFGTVILAKLQLAALKRSEQKQKDRKPFYLYVDEFQNFATVSFTQMLSEARKYKLYLTMAEQSTQQQDDRQMIEVILANVGTVVAFRTGSPRDEELMLPKFEPYVEKGEISNLPAYNFYCRISGVKTSEPMSGETLLLDNEGDS